MNEDGYEPQTSAMIALLPATTDWCKIELPHMTLIYAGEIADHDPGDFNRMAKDASALAMLTRPLTLPVDSIDVMGETDKVDVLRFKVTSELDALHHHLEAWDAGDWPTFKPHATIGPVGSRMIVPRLPDVVTFDRIYVGWGEDCLTWWLKMAGF